ncbi:hypothetical protein E2C01_071146 [Portunus trituberculatus]|uniref:Uncharacterized protein n=1 Tax=Portunus trituberculatus TaxID=210409 RepID=A0A5B7HW69_PORTR|nr:hypothetical protein [Portunus trituberculatus]
MTWRLGGRYTEILITGIRMEQWQWQEGRGQFFVYNHVCFRLVTRYFHH